MKALLIAAALALAPPALAAPVELPVKVADGATWTIESQRVREQERKEGPKRTETLSRYEASYRETKGVGRLTLRPTGGFFLGELPAGMTLDGFDFPLELEVDETMTPTRLRNWPQVRDAVYKLLDGQDPKVVAGMRLLFDPLTAEQAVGMFLPQMAYLGLGQGFGLEVGKPFAYEDALPNPLGGPAIKTQSAVTLERHDGREAVVVWTQALDRDSMTASMRVSIQVLLERISAPVGPAQVEAALKDARMARDSRCEFRIDAASGLARKTECSQVLDITVQGEKVRRNDTWTITQTIPKAR